MQKVKIAIDTKTMIRFWFVVIAFILAGFAIHKAQIGLIIIGVSVFMAVALNTPVSLMAKQLPGRSRAFASAISYIAIVILLGVIITLVVPPVLEQTAKFTEAVPGIVDNVIDKWTALSDVLSRYGLEASLQEALASLQQLATNMASSLGKAAVGSIGSVMEFLTALILVLVLTFLMLLEGPAWIQGYLNAVKSPEKREKQKRVLNRVYGVVTGYVNGQLIVSAIGATSAGLMAFILSMLFHDIPSNLAAPIAVITFTLSLIPMFGAAIAGTIAALVLAMNSFPAAIIYAVFFVIYQQIENNFIQPVVQGKRIALSPLVILIAITLGVYMYGVVGGLIAIPVAGTIQVLWEEYGSGNKFPTNTEKKSTKKRDK